MAQQTRGNPEKGASRGGTREELGTWLKRKADTVLLGACHSPHATGLTRQLGLWSAVAIVIGTTIGSGIFRTPAGVADRLPGPLPILAVWITGGILALCGALTLAEVAGAYPNTGGIFDFIRRAWGRLAAFLFGWAELCDHPRRVARRDLDDVRRVLPSRAGLRPARGAVSASTSTTSPPSRSP